MAANDADASDREREEIEIIEENIGEKEFKCCGKPCRVLVCKICYSLFHESCSKRKKNLVILGNGLVKCCNSIHPENINDSHENKVLQTEIYYLKALLEEVKDKNRILQVSNDLLIDKLNEVNAKNNKTTGIPSKANEYGQEITAIDNKQKEKQTPSVRIHEVRDLKQDTASDDLHKFEKVNNAEPKNAVSEDHESNSKQWSQIVIAQNKKMNDIINLGNNDDERNSKIIDNSHWTTVVRKNTTRRNTVLCTGSKVDPQSRIKGATKKKWIYVGKIFGNQVTERDLHDYLKNSTNIDNFEIKKLPTKGTNSAFSIGAPSDELYKKLLCPESWPVGVLVGEFNFRNFFRSQNGRHREETTQRPH